MTKRHITNARERFVIFDILKMTLLVDLLTTVCSIYQVFPRYIDSPCCGSRFEGRGVTGSVSGDLTITKRPTNALLVGALGGVKFGENSNISLNSLNTDLWRVERGDAKVLLLVGYK